MSNRIIVILALLAAVGVVGFAADAAAQLKDVKTTGNIQVRSVESDTVNTAPVSNGMI